MSRDTFGMPPGDVVDAFMYLSIYAHSEIPANGRPTVTMLREDFDYVLEIVRRLANLEQPEIVAMAKQMP